LNWGEHVPLKEYRAFVMSNGGQAIDLIGLDCESEEDAKERARQLVADTPVELWDGPRRIARFDPRPLKNNSAPRRDSASIKHCHSAATSRHEVFATKRAPIRVAPSHIVSRNPGLFHANIDAKPIPV
jgi:hypothetical protein